MAEVVLSPLLDKVIGYLASGVLEEFKLQRGVKKDLEKLSRTLTIIQAVVSDAEEKQVRQAALKIWLKELKDVAYSAGEVLDEFRIEEARRSKTEDGQPKNQVSNFFSPCFCYKKVRFQHKIGKRIKEIREKIDEIANERSQFDLREGIAERQPVEDLQQTDSFVIESEVYGREKDKDAIIERLLTDEGGPNNLSVISIIGLGGLGKTTLAQLAYNDNRVEKHFELRIWICVSDNFDVRQLTKSIVESISGEKCDLPDMDSMQRRLKDTLNGKKFFIVLDDVWNEDQGKWEKLRNMLICGSEGSKAIVTTRIEKVAHIMGTVAPYHLKGLSEKDCGTLFRQRAFGGTREEDPKLVAIGVEIVKKCGGVPLAAKALGSLMRFKTEERDWLAVKDSEIWHLPEDATAILPALKLSYYNLPPHLRQCFAYCSVFPKDYEIEKEEVIQLWMANNFIPFKGKRELEDIGNEIFNELVWRSFFQDIQKDDYGNVITCKMHDLVHDLAQYIMGNECLNVDVSKAEGVPKGIRHLSLTRHDMSAINEVLCGLEALHTFYLLSPFKKVTVPPNLPNYKCLRVLDLSGSNVANLPISVENLKHLRYLNLSYTEIEALPDSMSTLLILQTLKLVYCGELCKLPSGMSNMIGLRHLDILFCDSLTHMPKKIGQLSCLKTLSTFIVGDNEGCRIGELKSLNLRGTLHIRSLENVRNGRDAKEANLDGKPELRVLRLSWKSNDGNTNSRENDEDVAEGLRPHCNVRRLEISMYGGTEFPYWTRDCSLTKLVTIKLVDCKRCQHLPPLGQLPLLRELYLYELDGVRCVGNELYGNDIAKGFPSLKELSFWRMPNLEEWSTMEGREVFPLLRTLDIYECPKLTRIPQLPSLERLGLKASNPLVLRSVANLTSLSSLEIYGFREVVSLPEEMLRNLTQLQNLSISNFHKLTSLSRELDNLTALKSLEIYVCHSLTSLPQEGLQNLTSLRTLEIRWCDKLALLSGGLQYLTALESLKVWGCPELVALTKEGMGQLTALRFLYIWGCPKLEALPEGLQRLTALQELSIDRCPHLERRCKKETGEDWHKIEHIPRIEINRRDITQEMESSSSTT